MNMSVIYDFITKYTTIDENKLIEGWQNRMALPEDNEYIQYYISGTKRIGTNTEKIDDYETTLHTLREYVVTIDINDYELDRPRKRATDLETVARSESGSMFFKENGVGLLFADDVRYMPFTNADNQYIYRYMLDLHIAMWDDTVLKESTAKEVKFEKIRNVDTYTPPRSGIFNVDVRKE